MSQQTTHAAAHAWWVTGRPELNDLCPLQLILGQGRLAAGAEEPTKYQAEMLAEPWNKRYARLLDSQCMPDDEMSPAADNDARGALTSESLEKALRRAFNLGQTYWQQADSESYSQNKKADTTAQTFSDHVAETVARFTAPSLPAGDGLTDEQIIDLWGGKADRLSKVNWIVDFSRELLTLAAPRQPMGAGVPSSFDHYQWIRNNYQEYVNVASLLHAMNLAECAVIAQQVQTTSAQQDDPRMVALAAAEQHVNAVATRRKERAERLGLAAQQDEREAALPVVSHTLAGFRGGWIAVHGHPPQDQDIWNAGVRSGMNRSDRNRGGAKEVQRYAVRERAGIWQMHPRSDGPWVRYDDIAPTRAYQQVQADAGADRAMLKSVSDDLEISWHYCERCGHGEPCKNMDAAYMLRDYLSAHQSPAAESDTQEGDKRLIALLTEAFGTRHQAIDDLAALILRANASRRDVARYRWLRSDDIEVQPGQHEITVVKHRLPFTEDSDETLTESALDAAIDAAMSREQSGGNEK